MAKGFDLAIHPDWMRFMNDQTVKKLDKKNIRIMLDEYLKEKNILSQNIRRKNIDSLMNIWIKNENLDEFQEKIILSTDDESQLNKIFIDMIRSTFQFFDDICRVIRRLENVTGAYTSEDLKRRMIEIWGDSSTTIRRTYASQRTYKLFTE